MKPAITNLLLMLGAIALIAGPLLLVRIPEGEEGWAGADAQAEGVIAALAPDYEPWFQPLFTPASGEVESMLFALQAALGAGGLGFLAGRLTAARRPPACS